MRKHSWTEKGRRQELKSAKDPPGMKPVKEGAKWNATNDNGSYYPRPSAGRPYRGEKRNVIYNESGPLEAT